MLAIEAYPALKFIHVSLVGCSGVLFAVRGAAVWMGQGWPTRRPVRVLSQIVDTLLLGAGVTLWLMLHLNPVRDAWLGTKLLLLLVYIAAGSLAMKGRSRLVRGTSYGCAIGVYLFIASVAVTHNPFGFLGS
ncbi:regulator SirB [Trinickia violacea]|uniref:Regulator SirB n=1 Tax=Trinickia violacea TaxID=2571746 RepID=A0A4P8J1E2_9BURK|nr:SirB2 family protein [Trinickia violacea]QCP54626.1 regulator SirB [Trinickia violacea]